MTDTSTTNTQTKTFADFGVEPPICEALAQAGIVSPFPIQELTLPLALAGADLIGQARTGTGKTLAFGIPLLQRVNLGLRKTQALVVVPTRELCFQVAEDLTRASAKIDGLTVVAVYGGKALEPQAKAVEQGAHVVVGTPGRLLDLLRRGSLTLSGVQALVLDEADEMLDLGFLPDVEQLIQATAEGRQTLLFSATMPSAVVALARRYMHKPTFLRADVEEVHVAPKTKQYFFSCHRMDKPAVLARVLTTPNRGLCVVFTRTKRMADVLAEELRERGVKAAPIHSDLRQEAREKALERFRKGTITVLVATEVAARGLDIDDVTHVVNYDCPEDEKMYLHRIGRTGRAGADGVAITMALWNELARLEMIKKTLDITEPTHEVFSTSPILDELFNLPPKDGARRAPVPDDEDEDVVEEAKALLAADAATTSPEDAEVDAPETRVSGDDERSGEPRKRRRRGGRGRSRGGEGGRRDEGAIEDTRTSGDGEADVQESKEPVARQAKAARPAEAADTDVAADAGEDTGARRTRTRTRTVSRSTETAAEAETTERRPRSVRTSDTASTEKPARSVSPAVEPAGDEDGERTRVRRRTRTTGGGTRPESEEARPARGTQPRAAAKPAEASKPRQAKTTETGEARPARERDRSRGERGDRGGRGAQPARGRDARTGRARDPRARDPRAREPRRDTPDVDPEVARDGARPVISRPLKIQHLP